MLGDWNKQMGRQPRTIEEDRELRKANKKRYSNGWTEYFAMHRNRKLNPKQYGSTSQTDSSAGPVNRGRDWYGK